MTPRRIPPLVSQLTALLPDGSVDPASRTDCGESVLSSALRAFDAPALSPGCIRQAMGKTDANGSTTGADLHAFLIGCGFSATLRGYTPEDLQSGIRRSTAKGHLVAALGYWQGPAELHWILFYGWHPRECWAMDPWVGEYTRHSLPQIAALSAGVAVTLHRR